MSAMTLAAAPVGKLRIDRGIGLWLLTIAAMIAVMVVVGGLTRLTGSGLSITEWRPVTGALPPLGDAAWQAEFAKYQGTTQYDALNRGMGLAAFKAIYWWEWAHRFIARLIGFVVVIPAAIFWRQGRINAVLMKHIAVIFALGAAQAVLGWWMVQSGLAGRVSVSQYRLAAHLGLAFLLFGYVLWTALATLGARRGQAPAARLRPWALALAGLVFVQILMGALVAGLDAGLAFNTWPTYGGAWIPPGLYDLQPWWANHFENHALAHVQHRTLGYVAAVLAVWLYVALRRAGADKPVRMAAAHVLAFVAAQIVLGVLTVITAVALPLAALHQLGALGLFGSALWLVYTLTPPAPVEDRR